jgi:hypothetical protein
MITAIFYWAINRKKVGDWYWNSFFLFFLTWKLSYMIFNVNMFLDMPFSIVYFNGGTEGIILALALLSLYLLFIAGKKYRSINQESIQIFLIFVLSYGVVINILEQQNSIETFVQVALFIGYITLLLTLRKKQLFLSNQLFIALFMSQLLIDSLFHSFISLKVLIFSWIGMTILILSKTKTEG